MSIKITLELSYEDYPILKKIKKEELNNIIQEIFDEGYKLKFNILSDNNNNILTNKLNILENTLNKLIGFSSNSAKKGEIVENILENIIIERYNDITYKKTNNESFCGDGWITLPDGKIIMIESKNYSSNVSKEEILKMERDMIVNHINFGIFISFVSGIQGMREMDFHTFIHNNETYNILMISNLSNDLHKLDLGMQIIRKIMYYYDNLKKFPWITKNIKNELNNLSLILEKNYLLRDAFVSMEKDIHKHLNNYYQILRDFQYDLEIKIKEIINNINQTMEVSIKNNIDDIDLFSTLPKKINQLLQRILDICKKKKYVIICDNKNYIIKKKENIIGNIKIQTKKIIIELTLYDILINLVTDKEKEMVNNLTLLETLLV
jgi:hypothetical protein